MKGIKTITTLLFAGSVLFAQESQQWAGDIQSSGYFAVGTANLNVKSVNAYLKANNLPELNSRPISFEIGKHLLIQQLVLEASLGGIFWIPKSIDNMEVSLMSGYGMATMGVNFTLPGSSWQVYPFFNIGGGIFRFSSHVKTDDFNSTQTSTPVNGTRILPSFFTGTGAGIIKVFYDDQKKELLTFGIKAGIMLDPTKQTTWYGNGTEYAGGPSPLFSGPYVQVILGKGEIRK